MKKHIYIIPLLIAFTLNAQNDEKSNFDNPKKEFVQDSVTALDEVIIKSNTLCIGRTELKLLNLKLKES